MLETSFKKKDIIKRYQELKKSGKIKIYHIFFIASFSLFLMFYFFTFFYYNFISIQLLKNIDEVYLTKKVHKDQDYVYIDDKKYDSFYEPRSYHNVYTFSDGFVRLDNINEDLTDMYWDRRTYSFSFPLNVEKRRNDTLLIDFNTSNINNEKEQLFCNDNNCFKKIADTVYLNENELFLFKDLTELDIERFDLGLVDNTFYLSILVKKDDTYKLKIYKFNDNDISFNFLIEIEILDKDNFGPSAFGGSTNDLLIVYSGFTGQIFRLKNEKELKDLSPFFITGLSSQGFYPEIEYIEKSRSFYICSSYLNRPYILKLWQDENSKEIGIVDISSHIFQNTRPRQIICQKDKTKNSDLAIIANIDNTWQAFSYFDNGFLNENEKQIVSNNINRSEEKVKAVNISSYNINSKHNLNSDYKVYIAGSDYDFKAIAFGFWWRLKNPSYNLYWKIKFEESDDKYYSPWFNNLYILNFETID